MKKSTILLMLSLIGLSSVPIRKSNIVNLQSLISRFVHATLYSLKGANTLVRLFILFLGIWYLGLGACSAQGTLDSGLVAYYPFNGNANDESGNGNQGAVNGATLTTDRFGNAVYLINYLIFPINLYTTSKN